MDRYPTLRQTDVLRALAACPTAPSLRELQRCLKMRSLSNVHAHLEGLSARGCVRRTQAGLEVTAAGRRWLAMVDE